MWKYPDEVKRFIAENVSGRSVRELVELTNKELGTNFTYSKMRSFLTNHGLRTGTKGGVPKGYSKLYPPEIQKFIYDNYKGTGHQVMADLLNKTFFTNYTKEQMKSYYARHKLNSGLNGQFIRGQKAWNKGLKGYMKANKTSFKKGHKPHNRVPIGTERVDSKDGYIYVKIQDGHRNKNWKQKHIIIWEQYNGPVPKGHVIIFGDGNNRNFGINNLICVSRVQLARLNQNGLIQKDADLTRTGIIIADMISKISERKKG